MTTDAQPGARDRILIAAIEILSGSSMTERLSVRSVAAKAGVSVGSLRHHFPTQRALRDAALRGLYDIALPVTSIGDRSVPASDRLFTCLRTIVDAGGRAADARSSVSSLVDAFVTAEQTEQVREAYLAIAEEGLRRIESWLTTLAQQGELPEEEVTVRAQFLDTVLDGISLQRALPSHDAAVAVEDRTLQFAVRAVLTP